MTYVKTNWSNYLSNSTAAWSDCSNCCRITSSHGCFITSPIVFVIGSIPTDFRNHWDYTLLWTLESEELGLVVDDNRQLTDNHNIAI